MKILLTGANGFVGSHIAQALVAQGHEVICLVRKTSNLKWLENVNVKYVYGTLENIADIALAVKGVDAVVHAGGVVRAKSKQEYDKINAYATKNLAETVLKLNPHLKKFIFISSQAAMGPSLPGSPRKVNDIPAPVSDYGTSKMKAENMLKEVLKGKIPYTILRPASVYGPRDKDILIFFNIVNKHLKIKTRVKRRIQLVFVKDVAKAVVLCLENAKSDNKTYYLADSPAYTWQEVASAIAKVNNIKAVSVPAPDFVFKTAGFLAESFAKISGKTPVLNNQKITEMLQERWTGDNTDIVKDLCFSFTNLEIGAKITYLWYLDNKFF